MLCCVQLLFYSAPLLARNSVEAENPGSGSRKVKSVILDVHPVFLLLFNFFSTDAAENSGRGKSHKTFPDDQKRRDLYGLLGVWQLTHSLIFEISTLLLLFLVK